MNKTLQKRIEEAKQKEYPLPPMVDGAVCKVLAMAEQTAYKKGATFALQNQWIPVEEALPIENRILALLSKNFCGKDNCYEILCRIAKEHIDLRHPDGYYDSCGENIPTSAITHWMSVPPLEGGEE